MSIELKYVLVSLIAYILGSVSTGILVSKALNGPNLYKVGSKSTGASNVLRSMGKKAGLITFIGDCAKAILATLIGKWICVNLYGALLAGLFVVIGHNWPIFFHMKGGKGVASSIGVMIVTFPIPALICYAAGIVVIAITRFISLGSMILVSMFALIVSIWYANGDILIIIWTIVLALICIMRHHANIGRLCAGKERKLGQKV